MAVKEYPEVGEYVIATVDSIFKQGAFVKLDEYGGKQGMLPLSEISLKWVRNIRDYVREGQKVVLVVLGVNPERGHIDLSLRRVQESKRKEKLQAVKQRQRAEKLFEVLAAELNVSVDEVKNRLGEALLRNYGSYYTGLEAVALDEKEADKLNLPPGWVKPFTALVKNSIKIPYVSVMGYVELRSYEPDGVNIIKEALKKIQNYKTDPNSKIEVNYISPPMYRVKVVSPDYKTAERLLKSSAEEGIAYIRKHSGVGEFHRKIEEVQK